ncbi:MAG: hypothetical protein HQL52_12320 [Magnetococcales bacterium]|nr:hypothetical protein [Magnetococcales bacterium]
MTESTMPEMGGLSQPAGESHQEGGRPSPVAEKQPPPLPHKKRAPRPPKGLFIWMAFIAIYPFFKKLEFIKEIPIIGMLEEVLMLLLLPHVFRGLAILFRAGFWGYTAFFAYVGYLIMGVISWVGSGIDPAAMVFQLALEQKFPVITLAFIGAGQTTWIWSRFSLIVKFLLLLSLPLVVFQIMAPHTYDEVFAAGGHTASLTLPNGYKLPRGAGAFWFPGEMAGFCAMMGGFFYISMRFKKPLPGMPREANHLGGSRHQNLMNQASNTLWLGLASLLLVLAFSRQEFAGFVLCIAFIWFISLPKQALGVKPALILLLSGLGALIFYLLLPYFIAVAESLELTSIEDSQAARVVFYYQGVMIALDKFPLGGGLGGFAGHAAATYGSPLYDALEFHRFWWYRAGEYLTDTFWPHILGEAGFIGLFCYLLSIGALAILFFRLARKTRDPLSRVYLHTSLFTVLYMMSVSVTSPVWNGSFELMLACSCFGILGPALLEQKRLHSQKLFRAGIKPKYSART